MEKILFKIFENYAKKKKFYRFCILFHANQNMTLEEHSDLGLQILGYFMKNGLNSTVEEQNFRNAQFHFGRVLDELSFGEFIGL